MSNLSKRLPLGVLYVDDEVKALHYFREAFEEDFPVFTAENAADGYRILLENPDRIAVLVTDQRMPGENGVELMEKARLLNPNQVRILVTAYTDYKTAVDAVNAGHAFRYLHKPWEPEELLGAIRHGLRYYEAVTEREALLKEKADMLRQMIMGDRVAGMGILAEGLNHHLRNALTVIRAFIELAPHKLAEELNGAQPRDHVFWGEWQGQSMSQMDRIQRLLTHLSAASQTKSLPRLDRVQVKDVLSEAIQRYSTALLDRGLSVGVEIESDLPTLTVNKERFQQMWHLLLTQALIDLEDGQDLLIDVGFDESLLPGGQVVMRIADTGDWSKSEEPAHLFHPFFVRANQPNEFGVNMMACYVIVHLHGGTIEAKPRKPYGIEIEIRFPCQPAERLESEEDFFQRFIQNEKRWRTREQPEVDFSSAAAVAV